MISKKIRTVGAGVAALVALGAVAIGGTLASAAESDQMPTLEEDYSYPGAERVLAERGIKLIKGSGSIMLADCPTVVTNELIWVNTISGYVCFRATSNVGYLTMEIDEVFSIRGDNNNGSATVTVGDETETVTLPKGTWRGVGVGEDEDKPLAVLLELRLTA